VGAPCKACNSELRPFIDGQLRAGSAYTTIVQQLASKGQVFNISNLSRHRPHVMREDEERLDDDIDETVEQLREERNRVAPTLRASYSILIRFLESVKDRKAPTAHEALAAAKSISELGGMSNSQRFLLDFAEKAWAPGGGMRPPEKDEEPFGIPPELED
jgi:hypothetical protein